MPSLLLYGTLGCHLCDDAKAWMHHFFPEVMLTHIDIAIDERLVEIYGVRIPVLSNGADTLDWPFAGDAVLALIENVQPALLAERLEQDNVIVPKKTRRVLGLSSTEK